MYAAQESKVILVYECCRNLTLKSILSLSSKSNQDKQAIEVQKKKKASEEAPKHIDQAPTALFFQYNTQLGPPYHVLVDTNFINFRFVALRLFYNHYHFGHEKSYETHHSSTYNFQRRLRSIKNKLEIYKSMMDCLLAKCIPCITDCVMAELEKLGTKYRLALRLAKDPRFERLPCTHKGTYADDCLLQRCQQHRCYIVATCDKDLKRKIRKV